MGKSFDEELPPTQTLLPQPMVMAYPNSSPLPPRYVEKRGFSPVRSRVKTKASVAPPRYEDCMGSKSGKFVEAVKPITDASPREFTAMRNGLSNPFPPT